MKRSSLSGGTFSLHISWEKLVTAVPLYRACTLWFATDPTTPFLSYPPCFTNDSALPGPFSYLGLWPRESLENFLLSQIASPAHCPSSHFPPDNTHVYTQTHTPTLNQGTVEPISPAVEPVETSVSPDQRARGREDSGKNINMGIETGTRVQGRPRLCKGSQECSGQWGPCSS